MTTTHDRRHAGLGPAILGALLIAVVSTLGDVVWFEFRLPHRAVYGLAHGALLCLAIGLYLGALARRPWAGALGGAAVGFLAAAGYFVLAPLTGPAVMFALWMALWVLMAALMGRLAGPGADRRAALGRGAAAAVASGLAFYLISDIWIERPAGGRNYAVHFASWTLAYLPAFLALLTAAPRGRRA